MKPRAYDDWKLASPYEGDGPEPLEDAPRPRPPRGARILLDTPDLWAPAAPEPIGPDDIAF